jgi:hypothetical protein
VRLNDPAIQEIQVSPSINYLLEGTDTVLANDRTDNRKGRQQARDVPPFKTIRKLTMRWNSLQWLQLPNRPEPCRLVDQNHEQFSIRHQCELLWIKVGVSGAEAFPARFHQRLRKRGLGGKLQASSSHLSAAEDSSAAMMVGKLINDPPPAMEFISPAACWPGRSPDYPFRSARRPLWLVRNQAR